LRDARFPKHDSCSRCKPLHEPKKLDH
jgi:hypothetical protein